MKKVLVLGGTNFFGKKAVQRLLDKGYDVTIATRGHNTYRFDGDVKHIILDAVDATHPGWEQITRHTWDVVFDNICYTAQDAQIRIDHFGKQEPYLPHYFVTSSLAVYTADKDGYTETDFEPLTYHIDPTKQVDYGEGKRQVEHRFFTSAPFKVTAFRFPIVLGKDDYTRRLHHYIEKSLNGDVIQFNQAESKISFIQAITAAESIVWAIETQQQGPLNISSRDAITCLTFTNWLAEMTGQKIMVEYTDNVTAKDSPFTTPHHWYLLSDKVEQAGFSLDDLSSWLKPLIRDIAVEIEEIQ